MSPLVFNLSSIPRHLEQSLRERTANDLITHPDIMWSACDAKKRNLLAQSCCFNLPMIADKLIDSGRVALDSIDKNGESPLHLCCRFGHPKLALKLIETGQVKVDRKNNKGETPFLLSIKYGHKKVASALIQTEKISLETKDHQGRSALHYACLFDEVKIAKWLNRQELSISCFVADEKGKTVLDYAIEREHDDLGRRLIKKIQDFTVIDLGKIDDDGNTPLLKACQKGLPLTAHALIQSGKSQPEIINEKGESALSLACANEKLHIVAKTLIEFHPGTLKGDLNEYPVHPLKWACMYGEVLDAKMIIRDMKEMGIDGDGDTELTWAIQYNIPSVVHLLLKKEWANPNYSNMKGITPFMTALECKNVEIVCLFAATGIIDLNRAWKGQSVINMMVHKRFRLWSKAIMIFLRNGSISPTYILPNGRTILLAATRKEIHSIVNLIMDLGGAKYAMKFPEQLHEALRHYSLNHKGTRQYTELIIKLLKHISTHDNSTLTNSLLSTWNTAWSYKNDDMAAYIIDHFPRMIRTLETVYKNRGGPKYGVKKAASQNEMTKTLQAYFRFQVNELLASYPESIVDSMLLSQGQDIEISI